MKDLKDTAVYEILKDYAKEDLEILKANGCSAITGTKVGCLHNSYENKVFTIAYNMGQNIFQTPDEECVMEFFIDHYQVG